MPDKKNKPAEGMEEYLPFPMVSKDDSIRIVFRNDKAFCQFGDSIKFEVEVLGADPESGFLNINGFKVIPDENGIYHWGARGRNLSGDVAHFISWRDTKGEILSKLISIVYVLPPLGYIHSEYGNLVYRGIEIEKYQLIDFLILMNRITLKN